ncbi:MULTISPECIES: hypothetical protein [Methylobacterium]|uniref:hypothetical protein n=1 Tax=Methylobacterium TaxID=407 RepID=UPI0011CB4B00|nr:MULTISPECIES: hypothetical protein [Methylobacterium]TXM68828.1 hypothetical protein FV229_06900 [Methylobacterium sp. WL120]
MNDEPIQEAANALRAMGWKVVPTCDDLGLWQVDDEQLGDADLMALARLVGLMTGPEMIH